MYCMAFCSPKAITSIFTTCIHVLIKVHSENSAVKSEDPIVKRRVRHFLYTDD